MTLDIAIVRAEVAAGQEPPRFLAAVAGFLFAGLAGAVLLVPQMPPAGASPSTVVAYVEAHQRALEWTWFLSGEAAWVPGLMFCGGLAASLIAKRAAWAWATIGLAFAGICAALTMSMSVPWGLLVYLAPQIGPGTSVLLLAETRHFADATASFASAGLLFSFGIASSHISRRWRLVSVVGWAAALAALAHGVIDFIAFGQTGFLLPLSSAALLAWVLLASAMLCSGTTRTPSEVQADHRAVDARHLEKQAPAVPGVG